MESSEEEQQQSREPRRKPHTRPPRPDAKLLVFDIEITGLPENWQVPYTDVENWPRLVSMAWTFMNGKGKRGATRSYIVKPDGYEIPKLAAKVHEISTKKALKEGTPLDYVLADFAQCLEWADLVLAHNLEFKETVVRCEAYRLGREMPFEDSTRVCTMKSTKRTCRIILPDLSGYKYPTFGQLYSHCFRRGYGRPHEAVNDVDAVAEVVQYLLRKHVLRVPSDH